LGKVESTLQNDGEAAKDFVRAVELDPGWWNRAWGWPKSQNARESIPRRFAQLDEIIRLDKDNASSRYLRGQVLLRMGREKEGRDELSAATKMLNEQRAARHKELEGEAVQRVRNWRGNDSRPRD
jgi:tetratricopeptide (TPR) repeat protein